jgi:integrase
MARPAPPIGSWGKISTKVTKTDSRGKSISHVTKANFRNSDGHVRDVTATGRTSTAAEQALLQKLRDRASAGQSSDLTAMHKITHLLDLWIEKFQEQIADGRRSPTSLDTYQRAIKNHVRPALGELRIGEATTPRIDNVIAKIKQNAGAPTARTSRAVISGMMQLAVRYGAITVNPVREVDRIEHPTKKLPRALRTDEAKFLRGHLKTKEPAVRAELPDLVTFMLSTGVRIDESLAVLWHQVDLDAGTVDITHTIVRVKSQGLLRNPPNQPQATASSASPTG